MKLIIKVLCPPCIKCTNLLGRLDKAIHMTHADADIEHVTNFKHFANYSANVSQCPILVINGSVEFVQLVPFVEHIATKISQIQAGH